MNYLQAIKVIEDKYASLIGKTLVDAKTGHTGVMDVITIKPNENYDLVNYPWWDATDLNYAMFLENKDCIIVFLFDWKKKGMFGRGGTMTFEQSIGDYMVKENL